MYEQDELDKLFKACKEGERLGYEFFLITGMREQEVMYTYWSDVNFAASTVRVRHKPDRNWTPRAYKEREIPISAKLAQKLKARKAKADTTCGLVFPTAGYNPKLDFFVPNVRSSIRTTFGFTNSARRLRHGAYGRE